MSHAGCIAIIRVLRGVGKVNAWSDADKFDELPQTWIWVDAMAFD